MVLPTNSERDPNATGSTPPTGVSTSVPTAAATGSSGTGFGTPLAATFEDLGGSNGIVDVGRNITIKWTIVKNPSYAGFQELFLVKTKAGDSHPELLPVSTIDLPEGDVDVESLQNATGACSIVNNLTLSQCSNPDTDLFVAAGDTEVTIQRSANIPVNGSAFYYYGLRYLDPNTDNQAYYFSQLFNLTDPDNIQIGSGNTPVSSVTSSSAIPTSSSVSTPTNAGTSLSTGNPVSSSAKSSGLSTGAKVGIAVGVVGGVVLLLLAALLFFHRKRKSRTYAHPSGAAYSSHNPSGERDLHAEKEMKVMSSTSSPYELVPSHADGGGAGGVGAAVGAVPAAAALHDHEERERTRDLGSEGYRDHHGATTAAQTPSQAPTALPPNQQSYSPVRSAAAGVSHLQEPGMSPDELARLEEEERRLDEAIAEAERRRK